MKNFKNKIEKKNIEIKGLINLKKNIVLFGYNQITEFFIKNELITTCVIDKKYIKEIKKKIQIKKIKLITIDEIIPESIIINCITGINAGLIHKRFKTLGHHVFSWIQLKHALKLNKLHYWYLGNFHQFFFKNILKYQKTYEALADFRSKREYIKILSYKVTGNEKTSIVPPNCNTNPKKSNILASEPRKFILGSILTSLKDKSIEGGVDFKVKTSSCLAIKWLPVNTVAPIISINKPHKSINAPTFDIFEDLDQINDS